jgi:hypothetical protein
MNPYFLNIPEEVYLLSIDENGNQHSNFKSENFDLILSSALLMELALQHSVDSDQTYIIPDKPVNFSDRLLNTVQDEIIEFGNPRRIESWISHLSIHGQYYRDEIITSLVKKEVLRIENEQLFWFFSKRKYPRIGDKELEEVQLRIRHLIFGNDLPNERDIVIVSLLANSNLLETVFTAEEVATYKGRIEQIAKMDFIGQTIAPVLKSYDMPIFAGVFKKKSAEEMLEEHVQELKTKFRITDNENLPAWIRPGTDQYHKTLEYVREKGTAAITFNPKTKEYSELKIGYYNGY